MYDQWAMKAMCDTWATYRGRRLLALIDLEGICLLRLYEPTVEEAWRLKRERKQRQRDYLKQDVVTSYMAGSSIKSLARDHDVSPATVHGILVEEGIVRRRRGRPKVGRVLAAEH